MIDTLASPASSLRLEPMIPSRKNLLLLVLLGAVLMMPISYRAGDDQAHVHTIFQGMIDAIVGHQHAHDAQPVRALAPSPFSPPGVPLAAPDTRHTSPSTDPDLPQQIHVAGPVLAIAALMGLGALVAALLATFAGRLLWFFHAHLTAIDLVLEPPPPRPALPC